MQLQGMLAVRARWRELSGPQHDIVLSSRVRLARNLAGALFTTRANEAELNHVLSKIISAAKRISFSEAPFLKLADLDRTDRRFLVERHLISPLLAENSSAGGVIFEAGESVSLMANEEDHLRLSAVHAGLSLQPAYVDANRLDDALAESLDFSFSKDWGYLTACPTNLGTGMRASCLVHLPALGLANRINQVLESLPRAGLTARGLHGEGTKVLGDFYQISNATALGRSELEMVSAIENAVSRLSQAERRLREEMAAGPEKARLEDMVYRSAGVLGSARLLSFEEACRHLSLLRVGLSLGWTLPGSVSLINELMTILQPAHLEMRAGRELSQPERDALRADLARKRLGGQASNPA